MVPGIQGTNEISSTIAQLAALGASRPEGLLHRAQRTPWGSTETKAALVHRAEHQRRGQAERGLQICRGAPGAPAQQSVDACEDTVCSQEKNHL